MPTYFLVDVSVVTVASYTMPDDLHFPFSGQSALLRQLHGGVGGVSRRREALWVLMCTAMLRVQLYPSLMLFLLKILCSFEPFGKCFATSLRNTFPTLVCTSWLKGGVNQMIFWLQVCFFAFAALAVGPQGWNCKVCVCPLAFGAS